MPTVKRHSHPITPNKTAKASIQGSPDTPDLFSEPPAAQGMMQGRQRQVSFAMPPELLARVDETARKLSLTRAGFMKLALTRAVEAEKAQGR
ncbi:MAG: hypothetical protein A2486_02665 [Burkholderiales bacterium RIFOXYC12_FULL_65_23]|nr:MAG: hypothetical protein A2486_02665 [Burkholderiales bacterium RIFOXYC12_FULL_65_23]